MICFANNKVGTSYRETRRQPDPHYNSVITADRIIMPFKPIKPKKISSQIADQIRSSILAGEFPPGAKLPPERELAELFGVSRPSVREALNMLSSSGLVTSHQGGGTVVLSLVESGGGNPLSELIRSQQERALDVIEVRKGLESWTAYYAALRALPEDIRRLRRKCAECSVKLLKSGIQFIVPQLGRLFCSLRHHSHTEHGWNFSAWASPVWKRELRGQ